MRLRSALSLLAIATAAPLLFVFLLSVGFVYNQENQSIKRSALARNRATLEAIDAEIRGSIGVLRALATSPDLISNDHQAFYLHSRTVLATQPSWLNIILFTQDGRQLTNARMDWGVPLPTAPVESGSLAAAIKSGQPAVGNITPSRRPSDDWGIPVRLPVFRDGRVVYVITVIMRAQAFQDILAAQRLPDRWVSGIVGTDGRVIARVPAVIPGERASSDYLEATQGATEGWYRGKTLEGHDTYTAFSRSSLTGWSIGYAIPADVILGTARRSIYSLTAGMGLSVIFALAIGVWLTRRIAVPIAALAKSAQWIGTDVPVRPVHSEIAEVDQLSKAISMTAASIRERDAQLRESKSALERQAAELREQETNRSVFLALLSHELRNPLAPLRTGLALLRLHPEQARREATEAMMDRQITHLTRLIDDLLDIGRIDRGQIELKSKPVDLLIIARHALEAAAPLISSRQHELVTLFPERPVWIQGDTTRLEQILGNLLTNAAKYTPEGGRIELQIAVEADHAVVTVSDNGIGFDQKDSERLFKMFTRLPQAGERDSGGLGIGLSLAKALVALHRGEISAASRGVGQGAVFTVRLPLVAERAPAEATDDTPNRSAFRKNLVLIADDNVDATGALADYLKLNGADVAVAFDGLQAIELLRALKPSVAFIDINMPGADGRAVARAARGEAWGEAIVLVALTGMGLSQDQQATKDAGFDAHLVKPADLETIRHLATMTREQTRSWSDERSGERSRV